MECWVETIASRRTSPLANPIHQANQAGARDGMVRGGIDRNDIRQRDAGQCRGGDRSWRGHQREHGREHQSE
jgi:hypothetical protein